MLTLQHIHAIKDYIKAEFPKFYQPEITTQIIEMAHSHLTYSVANSLWFPITWKQVGRVWVGQGGASIFVDPELEPEDH